MDCHLMLLLSELSRRYSHFDGLVQGARTIVGATKRTVGQGLHCTRVDRQKTLVVLCQPIVIACGPVMG